MQYQLKGLTQDESVHWIVKPPLAYCFCKLHIIGLLHINNCDGLLLCLGYKEAGCLVKLTSIINYSYTTVGVLPFDKEVYDFGGNFDMSSKKYQVPYNGTYLVQSQVLSRCHTKRRIGMHGCVYILLLVNTESQLSGPASWFLTLHLTLITLGRGLLY